MGLMYLVGFCGCSNHRMRCFLTLCPHFVRKASTLEWYHMVYYLTLCSHFVSWASTLEWYHMVYYLTLLSLCKQGIHIGVISHGILSHTLPSLYMQEYDVHNLVHFLKLASAIYRWSLKVHISMVCLQHEIDQIMAGLYLSLLAAWRWLGDGWFIPQFVSSMKLIKLWPVYTGYGWEVDQVMYSLCLEQFVCSMKLTRLWSVCTSVCL